MADIPPPEPSDPEAVARPTGGPLADLVGIVVGGQFVTAAIGLLMNPVLTRVMPKEDFGTYMFVTALFATARDFGSLSIPESILYFAPKVKGGELHGLVRQSMLLLLGLGVVAALVLAGLGLVPHVFLEGRHGLSWMLALVGFASIVGFPASVFNNLFIATNNPRAAAGISFVLTILGTAGTLIPAALGWPLWTLLAVFATNMTIRLGLSELVYRKLFLRRRTERFPGGVRAQMAYVWPLSLTRFAGIFNQKLDKVVVGMFFDATRFAEFAVGAQELPLVSILPYSVASTLLPRLVELYEKGADRLAGAREAVALWHAGIKKTTLVMLPVATFLLLEATPFIRLYFGERYAAGAVPFRIYSALLPLRVTSYGIMLNAFGRTATILRVQLTGMVLNVALSLTLMKLVGMPGAPLAAVLTQAFMIAVLLWSIDRTAKVGLSGIFPWAHYAKVALAAALAGVPVLAGLWFFGWLHPAILLGGGAVLYLPAYLGLSALLRTMGPEDREFVARWLRLEPLRRKRT